MAETTLREQRAGFLKLVVMFFCITIAVHAFGVCQNQPAKHVGKPCMNCDNESKTMQVFKCQAPMKKADMVEYTHQTDRWKWHQITCLYFMEVSNEQMDLLSPDLQHALNSFSGNVTAHHTEFEYWENFTVNNNLMPTKKYGVGFNDTTCHLDWINRDHDHSKMESECRKFIENDTSKKQDEIDFDNNKAQEVIGAAFETNVKHGFLHFIVAFVVIWYVWGTWSTTNPDTGTI